MTKTLSTLIEDIYSLFKRPNKKVTSQKEVEAESLSKENLDIFFTNLEELLRKRLEPCLEENKTADTSSDFTLRMSKIGVGKRKLWFESRQPVEEQEITPVLSLRFLYGDILEELLLLLTREAGHDVKGEQDTLNIDGIEGHRDAIIDGQTIDIKSASSFAFKKFSEGKLFEDDAFGYIPQLSAYSYEGYKNGETETRESAFFAINKETGELSLLNIHPIDMIDPVDRISELKECLDEPTPPEEFCFEPVRDGKSGNLKLHKNCEYCPFKYECWKNEANQGSGLRAFQYSNGLKHLVHIESLPSVPEVTSELDG